METPAFDKSFRLFVAVRTRRWRSGLYCVLCLIGLLLAQAGFAAEQRVRVGVYQNAPKIDWPSGGRPEGIFIDLIEAIALQEGWTIEYVPGTFSEGLARISAGQIDLMPDVALTKEREQKFAFHREPVLSSWNQVYAPHGSGIRSLLDLDGKRVAVLEGSMQQEFFRQMMASFSLKVTLVAHPDFAAAFRSVADGKTDAVITNRFYGMRRGATEGLENTSIIFNPSSLYFAAATDGNQALLEAIDKHLLAFKQDSSSVYFRSLRRWSGSEPSTAVPPWLKWGAVVAAALFLASAAWGLALRRYAARLSESELRQRQLAAELGRVFAHSVDAICVVNADLRFVRVSDACEKLWGYRPDELVGKSYMDMVPQEDREITLSVIRELREGTPSRPLESRSRRKDGSLVSVLWSAVWFAPDQLWYCIARDDSERRRLLDEVQRRARALERSAADLAVARDAAEAADRIKSAFLATMSHELRTPLNSIIGFTGIVLQGLAGPLNDEQAKQLGMVRDSSRHLLALINDVLDISKIEAGQLSVAAAPFDLAASIRKVAAIVGPLADKKGLELNVRVADGVGPMVGDARRVEQVMLNLLGNAIKFTDTGSVKLEVAPADDFVPAGFAAQPAVRLTVTDTGIGIKPEDEALLFAPFRQVESDLSRHHEGTGLGLAICKKLVELMGGMIKVESKWQQGSVFSVTLPLKPSPEDGPAGLARDSRRSLALSVEKFLKAGQGEKNS
jgi:PAS domain S-box-containing protein